MKGGILVARIIELEALCTPASLAEAREWANASLEHAARTRVLRWLESFERALEPESLSSKRGRRESAAVAVESDSMDIREFTAILSDEEFLSRSALVGLLEELFGSDKIRPSDLRRGRAELVAKGVRLFAGLSSEQQLRMHKSLRGRFLRNRGSTLSGWSAVISGGK